MDNEGKLKIHAEALNTVRRKAAVHRYNVVKLIVEERAGIGLAEAMAPGPVARDDHNEIAGRQSDLAVREREGQAKYRRRRRRSKARLERQD